MEANEANTPIAIAARKIAFTVVSPTSGEWTNIDSLQESINDLAYAIVDKIVEEVEARL